MNSLYKLCSNMGNYIHVLRSVKTNEYNVRRLKMVDFILKDYYNNNCNDWKKYKKNNIEYKDMNNIGYHKEDIHFNCDKLNISLLCSVITWAPRVRTVFHYHPNIACMMMPMNNGLQQDILKNEINNSLLIPKKNEIYKSCNMDKGECYYIDDEIGQHRIINNTDNYLVSINIYEPLYKLHVDEPIDLKHYRKGKI